MSNDNLAMEASVEELNQALETIKAKPQTEAQEPAQKEEAAESQETAEVVENNKKVEEQPEAQEETPAEEAAEEAVEQSQPGMDYRKSYEALRPWITRLSQEVSSLKKQASEVRQPAQPEVTTEQWQEAYDRDPIGTMQLLSQKVAEQNDSKLQGELNQVKAAMGGVLAQSAVDRARSKHEDFSKYEGQINESLGYLPPNVVANPANFDQVLEQGYWAAKGRELVDTQRKAEAAQQRKVVARRKAKSEAHVEGSAKTGAEQPVDLQNMSSDEIYKYMQSQGMIPG